MSGQYSRTAAYTFWTQKLPDGNNPSEYLKPWDRSIFLYKFMPKLDKKAKILEIGCNVGRNLSFLYNKGFKRLNGIEINPHAITVGKKHFQELYSKTKIYQYKPPKLTRIPPDRKMDFFRQLISRKNIYLGEAQEVMKILPDNQFDLIFSMAVLQHIPVATDDFFNDIVKKTKQFLLTLEDETHFTLRHFPRNYQQVFEKLGLKQIKSTTAIPNKDHNFDGFVARLFCKLT